MAAIGIVGATGLVGSEMLAILGQRRVFAEVPLRTFASAASDGREVEYRGRSYPVETLEPRSLARGTILLGATSALAARKWVPECVERGAVVVDNSSAFRMDDSVPLVVPEVNPRAIVGHKGIIANPNCSTIQLVVALEPLRRLAAIDWVCVSTYQSVSGAGRGAVKALHDQRGGLVPSPSDPEFDGNVLTEIGTPETSGFCSEESKLIAETAKIMNADFSVYPSAARVPVDIGHTEAVVVRFLDPVDAEAARQALEKAPGLVLDSKGVSPRDIAGRDEVAVGRIRNHPADMHILQFWVTADNLRKGAALNTIQIAELVYGGVMSHE